jgi:hypothetical protein
LRVCALACCGAWQPPDRSCLSRATHRFNRYWIPNDIPPEQIDWSKYLPTPGFHVLPRRWVGLAIVCVSLASRRALVTYGGLQVALWMLSVSVWNPILWLVDVSHTHYGLNGAGPFFLVMLALSLILVALYKPVTHGLKRLASSPG